MIIEGKMREALVKSRMAQTAEKIEEEHALRPYLASVTELHANLVTGYLQSAKEIISLLTAIKLQLAAGTKAKYHDSTNPVTITNIQDAEEVASKLGRALQSLLDHELPDEDLNCPVFKMLSRPLLGSMDETSVEAYRCHEFCKVAMKVLYDASGTNKAKRSFSFRLPSLRASLNTPQPPSPGPQPLSRQNSISTSSSDAVGTVWETVETQHHPETDHRVNTSADPNQQPELPTRASPGLVKFDLPNDSTSIV
mmetsp:Transcript_115/g.200  ORF Transcript_115/g.200 Transcript_115/m.200 type:complete len:253 (-) Transcript_115:169-927(-)